jgi:hypothetical protein
MQISWRLISQVSSRPPCSAGFYARAVFATSDRCSFSLVPGPARCQRYQRELRGENPSRDLHKFWMFPMEVRDLLKGAPSLQNSGIISRTRDEL